jgi:hypothetical protein
VTLKIHRLNVRNHLQCPDGSIVPPGEDCPEPPEDGDDGEDGSNGNEDDNEDSGGVAPVPPFG